MKPFTLITEAVKEANPGKLTGNWQQRFRRAHGDALEEILFDLAQGRAWIPTLPDGSVSAPVIPSSDVRLRAALALKEMVDGRAVPQTEIVKAEQESRDLEAVRALSDAELEAEARKILASRKPPVLNPGPPTEAEVVDERLTASPVVDENLDPEALGLQIWAAPVREEQE